MACPRFQLQVPLGAFTRFQTSRNSTSFEEIADLILEEGGVACLSGTAFGEFGEGYLRFLR
jgi:aspartate/methionine/tyrosine aminotransferase